MDTSNPWGKQAEPMFTVWLRFWIELKLQKSSFGKVLSHLSRTSTFIVRVMDAVEIARVLKSRPSKQMKKQIILVFIFVCFYIMYSNVPSVIQTWNSYESAYIKIVWNIYISTQYSMHFRIPCTSIFHSFLYSIPFVLPHTSIVQKLLYSAYFSIPNTSVVSITSSCIPHASVFCTPQYSVNFSTP